MSTPHLYSIAPSHPGMTAKLALDHKRIDYSLTELLPGLHPIPLRALGFGRGTVPALKIDGRRVQGSIEINEYLERSRTENPLYPEGEAGAAVRAAERWAEAELQPVPRRIFRWCATRSNEVRLWMARDVVGMPGARVMAPLNQPVARVLGSMVGASSDRVRADLAELDSLLGKVEELIDEGVIGGEPNAADMQIAPTVRVLLSYEQLRPLLDGRPAADHALRFVPQAYEPIPAAIPPEWLEPLSRAAGLKRTVTSDDRRS